MRTHNSAVKLGVVEPEEWKRLVGDKIRDQRRSLRIKSMRKAALLAGFNEAVWRQIETGRRQAAPGVVVAPTPTDDTKAAACRVLRWSPDSIDRLLAGLDAVEVEQALDTAELEAVGEDWAPFLEKRFLSLEGRVEQLEEVADRWEALLPPDASPPDRGGQ